MMKVNAQIAAKAMAATTTANATIRAVDLDLDLDELVLVLWPLVGGGLGQGFDNGGPQRSSLPVLDEKD